MNHSPEIQIELEKRQKPDRIYGLRQTRNFKEALNAPCDGVEPKLVRDVLGKYPCSEVGESLLFPFMVMEAKSGKSNDDWHSIRLQSCFSVFTFLEHQQKLKSANGRRSKWESGPLVWFFMNKGEDWRVCVAFQKRCGFLNDSFETVSSIPAYRPRF